MSRHSGLGVVELQIGIDHADVFRQLQKCRLERRRVGQCCQFTVVNDAERLQVMAVEPIFLRPCSGFDCHDVVEGAP